MQALANKCNARVQPFTSVQQRPARVRVVQCQAQQNTQLQQVAAAVAAATCLCVPAAHAATELIQPSMDVATAVGSGAAVAGLGALLVATDPQKR
jgi:magnesium-protoporphyrin O-methyltransferase